MGHRDVNRAGVEAVELPERRRRLVRGDTASAGRGGGGPSRQRRRAGRNPVDATRLTNEGAIADKATQHVPVDADGARL